MNPLMLVKRFWAAVLLPPTLLGIWYFPADLSESTSTTVAKPWRQMLAMLDRETLLWTVCIVLGGWIITTQVRPYLQTLLKRGGPIGVEPYIFCESENVQDNANRVRAYLVVKNVAKNRVTLRNVSANFLLVGASTPLFLRYSEEKRQDIRHGEYVLFEVGSCLFDNLVGYPVPKGEPLDENEQLHLEHNLPKGHLSLRVGREKNLAIGNPKGVELREFPFYVVVSADDVISTSVKVDLNLQLLPDTKAAFRMNIDPK